MVLMMAYWKKWDILDDSWFPKPYRPSLKQPIYEVEGIAGGFDRLF